MDIRPFTLETALTDYMPLPRDILSLDLPSTAILLYAMLLDRATLSHKNQYTDQGGWVYVVYTIEHLARDLGVNTRSVSQNLKLLQEAGLICRRRPVGNRASQIYMNLPSQSANASSPGKEIPPVRKNSSRSTGRKPPTNDLTKRHDLNEYTYQHSEEESL